MAGFTPDTLRLLRHLAADPDPTTFAANRDRYEVHWLAPARAFVTTVAPLLANLSDQLVADPRVHRSILHPRQDVRFDPDRPLYRDHVGLLFWEGDRATAASVLFLRVHPDHVTLGAGARRLDRDQLRAYRTAVVDHDAGRALVSAIEAVEGAGWPVHGETLATGPRHTRSEDPDRARLLRHTAVWTSADLPHPGVLGSARFASWCVRRWRQQWPLHRWLVDHVGSLPLTTDAP